MIFCGDTVFQGKFDDNIFKECDESFLKKSKVINLESLIEIQSMKKISSGIGLISSPDIVEFLKAMHVKACIMANNHITDFDVSIDKQKRFLKDCDIDSCGAGNNLSSAIEPCIIEENNTKTAILSFGWETISCIAADETSKGVNPLRYNHILKLVDSYLTKYPDTLLTVVFHWNYEYEKYPQPAHRKLAFKLIEMGVNAIIGHHPHIVQGAEIYRGRPIFYSLGNFYFRAGIHSGFKVTPPPEAYDGLCVEISDDIDKTMLYWTHLTSDGNLLLKKREELKQSAKIAKLTPFKNMSHQEYIAWFKANRYKNRLLPIYKNPESKVETLINDLWVGTRQQIIDFMVRLKSRH